MKVQKLIVMCNNIEAQIAEMEAEEDKQMFMEEYGMKEPALNRLIQTTYKLIRLKYLLYCWCTRSKGLDYTQRLESSTGCKCYSY
jgi:ribosome-binding ATPase YchF (GTP1/OBG family)